MGERDKSPVANTNTAPRLNHDSLIMVIIVPKMAGVKKKKTAMIRINYGTMTTPFLI
jgi:hypothetical protein